MSDLIILINRLKCIALLKQLNKFNQFCLPCFADGKDILEDIIDSTWNVDIKLIEIIEKIPNFLFNFINKLKEGTLFFYGNYYLGDKYDINILQNLPVCNLRLTISFQTSKRKIDN